MTERNGINFRVAVDGLMILSLIFFAGIGWAKLERLEMTVERLLAQEGLKIQGVERLARIEEKVTVIQRDVDRLAREVEHEDEVKRK